MGAIPARPGPILVPGVPSRIGPGRPETDFLATSGSGAGFQNLAHQNRTIAIASDCRVDGAKSPEIPQKEGVSGSEIAARNRRSLATFHRALKSQCSIALSCLGNRAISEVRDGHRNRKSQKSLRFRCAKFQNNTVRAEIIIEVTLDRAGPVTFQTFFSAIHLWGRSGRGHCRKFSAFREISATFRRISAPFPDAIKRIFCKFPRTFRRISANFPQKPLR